MAAAAAAGPAATVTVTAGAQSPSQPGSKSAGGPGRGDRGRHSGGSVKRLSSAGFLAGRRAGRAEPGPGGWPGHRRNHESRPGGRIRVKLPGGGSVREST